VYEQLPVSAIVAVANNGVIGVEGDLPWHIPADLRFFKRTTSGHVMLMGRRTWQSLPGVLPKRAHVVISRSLPPVEHPQVTVVRDIQSALVTAARLESQALAQGTIDRPELMIVGGGQLYTAMWPWVDRLYRTRIDLSPEGDTRFPAVDMSDFQLESATPGTGDPAHIFEIWQRNQRPRR